MNIPSLLDREMELLTRGIAGAFFWQTLDPVIIMGVSGRAERETRLDHCREDAVPIFQRRSGGGTVMLCPGVLCWGVVLPSRGTLCDPKWLSGEILPLLISGLAHLALPVSVRGLGDLTLGEHKICGTAQRWTRQGILIHGSLLVNPDLTLFTRYLAHPPREPDYRQGRSHGDFCTSLALYLERPVSNEEVASVIAPEFKDYTGSEPQWLTPH